MAVRVDPPEAWAADLWAEGGTTYYEWSVKVLAFQEDTGPSASEEWQLDTVAGEDGDGHAFRHVVRRRRRPGFEHSRPE